MASHPSEKPASTGPAELSFAGIHLSGPTTPKTAVVVLRGRTGRAPLGLARVYEKIGALGTLFSDERVVDILRHEGPFSEVFVDCPLTLPPCAGCARPGCPGAGRCEELSVAWMMALAQRLKKTSSRRVRTINPQFQRLWDVLRRVEGMPGSGEPSFSSNLAPLVVRARTLQRRLDGVDPRVQLRETSVPHVLELLAPNLGIPAATVNEYRGFEEGRIVRRRILQAFIERGWLAPVEEAALTETIAQSVQVFHAFVGAWVGVMRSRGSLKGPPDSYPQDEGWVWLPHFSALS
jgi:hypothetical protein